MALSSGIALLSVLGAAWLPVLVDAAVKGTVILIVASIVSLFVRRASAAARHLVWFLALVGLLGLPALSVALPGWQVLPGWFDLGRTAALDTQEAVPPASDEPAAPPAADSPPWSAGHSAGRPEASPSQPRPLGAASGTPPAPEAGASRSGSPAMNLRIWILPLWAAGAALSLAPVAIGLVSLRRLRRTSRRVADGPWAALLERLSAELGLKRRVVLLRSSRRSMPMAWGLVRPKLLIPEEAEGWSSECLRAVLLHELAHIKRWDCLTQLVSRAACGLYWFNPLAWLALHRMVAEHERACDDVVLAAGGRAPEYAEHLLEVASRLPAARFSLGVGIALARPSRLEGRLLAILDRKRSRRAVTRAAALGSILALAAVLVPLAVMRPTVQAEQAAVEKTAVAPASGDGAAKEAAAAAASPSIATGERADGPGATPPALPPPSKETGGHPEAAGAAAAGGTSYLRGGDTTDAGLKTYARLKNREGVEVESISGSRITDVGLKELADFRNLRALNLMCAAGVTDAGMKELKGCTGLKKLHLLNTGVSDAGLAELKGLDALEILYLSGPKITDAGLKVLRDFKGLREVCLLGTSFTDAGLKELKDLKDLRALHLRSPGITDAGLRELKGFTSLQVLSLTDTNITDAGLKELKGLSALRELNLRYTKVTDVGMREVAEFKALQVLDLTYTNVTDAGLKALEGLKGLRELHCVGAAVTAAGVERLRKALPNAEITSGEGAGARPTLDPSAASEPAPSPAVGDTDAATGLAKGRLVEIRGRVLDPAGKPVCGAKVFVAGRRLVEFAPEHSPPTPTTETDAEGRFRLPAPAEGAKGIAVSTPALRAWSMAIDGTGEEIALRLPEAGTLMLRYRMEGDDPEAVFRVELETWEMSAWKDVAVLRLKANAPNKGEVILANLPPGTYDLWREKSLAAGDTGIGVYCDRREATIAAGKTTVVEFTRGKGFRIAGRTAGLPEGAVPGVFVTVKAADAEANGPDYMVPRRDAVVCPPNGQFTTAPVPPGQYVLEASAYKPEPRTGVWYSRWRGPDFVGSARVTVPEDGPPESVRIEMQGVARYELAPASVAPLAPADEVLKQLTTIVELEERILAGVQERYQTGLATADEVGRQQLKVTDAKVRLAERKAELIAQGKEPRGAGDEAPGTSTQAALQDQIRRLLEEAVAQEEELLAQMRQRYDVGKATSEEVDRQQVRVTEAKVRLAERVKAMAAQAEKPAEAASKTSAAPAEAWGEPVEGVQCRLRANRVQWPLGLAPILKADVRNTGKRSFTVAQTEQLWDLEVDGRWYQWTGEIRVKSSVLDPGREYREIAFTLADPWHRKDGGDPLALKPGRHTVRVAALCRPDQDGAAMVRAMSNAVEIEILPGEAKPAATSAPVPVPVSTVPEKTPPAAGDARARTGQRIFPLKYQEADASEAVRAAPDGSSITLAKAEPEFGTLDTGCADLSLELVGEYGFRKLSGSGGKWQIPAGWHAATGATLSRSDAAGTLWSLHGVSSWGRLARFDVRSGQVLSLRAGPPLTVKVHPSGLQPNGMIHFALALVGQAGESYNAAPKRGDVPQPPRFRVLDEAGRALGSGVFNPGSEGTYSWCLWRVPEGFKGRCRIEVEGDWGPFEVSQADQEAWFSVK